MNAIRIDKSLINLCIDLRLRLRKKFSYFHIVISSSCTVICFIDAWSCNW